jgi:hypothetical protein
MALKLEPQFTLNDIMKGINAQVERVEKVLLDQMQQVGEQFVIDARSTNTYKDKTRNLRGSIGYIILKDGKQIFGNFQEPKAIKKLLKIKPGTEPEAVAEFVGDRVGKKLALEIGGKYPSGYVLIGVAGMNYAAAVEAKGYDVITGSSIIAEKTFKRAVERMQQSIKKLK